MIPTTIAIDATLIPDITRGAFDVAREGYLIAQCNDALSNTFTIGLCIGSVVGMIGLYIGMMWYRGLKI